MMRRRGTIVRLAAMVMLPVLLMPLPAAAAPASIATMPISRMDTPLWRQRFEAKQAEIRRERIDLLWLGDSITQDWEKDGPQPWRNFVPVWQRFYGDRHAIDLGFNGDSTCHLLWRLEHGELDGIRPKAAILLIGANNFGHVHTDADQTYDGIMTVIDLLHRRLPAMQLLVIGVLPSIRSPWVTLNTKRLNQRLAGLPALGPWLHFVDAGALFERDGRVDATRFMDPLLTPPDPPLHPTAGAQAAMAAEIEPLVATMMGDYRHR